MRSMSSAVRDDENKTYDEKWKMKNEKWKLNYVWARKWDLGENESEGEQWCTLDLNEFNVGPVRKVFVTLQIGSKSLNQGIIDLLIRRNEHNAVRVTHGHVDSFEGPRGLRANGLGGEF